MKKIALLGSSGSIGTNTLEVVRKNPHLFSVQALSCHSNVRLLAEQIKEFSPSVVCISDISKREEALSLLPPNVEILFGEEGLVQLARHAEYDVFVGAVVGFSGLAPTVEAIKRGKRIALANKETLVVAGELITELLKEYNAELIPVDSEHSALFQCLVGEDTSTVSKLILTASGGPFRGKTRDYLNKVTVAEALNHPTWKMGAKITIDSASLMNKGLEVIEAAWLFNLPASSIEVVVHPQSIIHSMVEFNDGSIKAQLSTPDMKLPIHYALTYPERTPANYVSTSFRAMQSLEFFEPDYNTFECLGIAFSVLEAGGVAPCIVNAANEVAVDRFLRGEIGFLSIPEIIKRSLDTIANLRNPDLETIFDCDNKTRKLALSIN